ncbi:MAG: efflux RND transporter periplasmic adaptor subunit [Pseudomonadales bacterium]|nr:efflux RND transporter periplasmic adaptor subunit [Pseudomonadales bacterium]
MLKQLSLLMLFAIVGCSDRSEPEPADQSIRPARVFKVQDHPKTLIHNFVGQVEATQSINMTFEVSGPLVQLPGLEGQTIKQGALVAAIESKDFELAVEEASLQLELAQHDLERKQQVLRQKGIARSVVDDAQSNYELQRVRLEKARESLADAKLLAPFDAYITRRYVDNFVNVRAGEKIVKLNDLHLLLIKTNIPESMRATVSNEQVISMYAKFDFAKGQRFELKLHEARGEADALAQTYEVRMSMARPSEYNILPGMTASVFVELNNPVEFSAVIPASALLTATDGDFFVWVYQPADQTVSKRTITVNMPIEGGVPVTSGLEAGELIVATGAKQLQTGMQIRVLGETSSNR